MRISFFFWIRLKPLMSSALSLNSPRESCSRSWKTIAAYQKQKSEKLLNNWCMLFTTCTRTGSSTET